MISGSNATDSSKSGSSILKKVSFIVDGEPGSTAVINNEASQRKHIRNMYMQVQFTPVLCPLPFSCALNLGGESKCAK